MDGQRSRISGSTPNQSHTWLRATRPTSMPAAAGAAHAVTMSWALERLSRSRPAYPAEAPSVSASPDTPTLIHLPVEILDVIAQQLPVYDVVSLAQVDRQTRARLTDHTESAYLLARASRVFTSQRVREVLRDIRGMQRSGLRGRPLAELARQLPALPREEWLFAFLQVRRAASDVPVNMRGPVIHALAAQICRLPLNERLDEARRAIAEAARLPAQVAARVLAQIPGNLVDVPPTQQASSFNAVLQATTRLPPEVRGEPVVALVRQYWKLPHNKRWDALCALVCEIPTVAPADRAFVLERLANGLDHYEGAELSVAYGVLCEAIVRLPRHERWRAMNHLIRQVNCLPKNERLKQFIALVEHCGTLPMQARSCAFYELAIELGRFPARAFGLAYACLAQAIAILPPKLALMPMLVLMHHSGELPVFAADDTAFQ